MTREIIIYSVAHGTKKVLVNEEDYEKIKSFRWSLNVSASGIFYAERKEKGVTVKMHRFLLGLNAGDKRITDHINGNGLDNRRENIRIANHSINALNSRKHRITDGPAFVFTRAHRRLRYEVRNRISWRSLRRTRREGG